MKSVWLLVILSVFVSACNNSAPLPATILPLETNLKTDTPATSTPEPTLSLKRTQIPPTKPPLSTATLVAGPVIQALDGQSIADGDQFAPLPLDEYISDAEFPPDEMIWRLLSEGELNAQIKRRVLVVTPPNTTWTGSESILLEACNPDGRCANTQVLYVVEFVNDAPVVADIDDQLILLGEEFQPIKLDDFVDDPDNSDAEIRWAIEGDSNLDVQIVDRVVSFSLPDTDWRGPESLQLTACDPSGLCDQGEIVLMVQEPDDLTITFVANAGFLMEAGEYKIAIDAFLQPWSGYQSLSESDVNKMRNARWPFDEIDLIFVTHDHFDHYSADVVAANLEQNPESIGLSTQGVAENLRVIAGDQEDLLERMIGKKIRTGERSQMILNGIGVELMNFPHGPGSPENMGVIFSIGGFRVFHTGDLNPDQTLDVLVQYGISDKNIDVAMVPAFWLSITRYQSFLDEINAPYIIPMHFDPAQSRTMETLQHDFPNAIIFGQIYESWKLSH